MRTTHEGFTDRALDVLGTARLEATNCGHTHIGTEHLLLALAKEGGGIAANLLKSHNMTHLSILQELHKLIGKHHDKMDQYLKSNAKAS